MIIFWILTLVVGTLAFAFALILLAVTVLVLSGRSSIHIHTACVDFRLGQIGHSQKNGGDASVAVWDQSEARLIGRLRCGVALAAAASFVFDLGAASWDNFVLAQPQLAIVHAAAGAAISAVLIGTYICLRRLE